MHRLFLILLVFVASLVPLVAMAPRADSASIPDWTQASPTDNPPARGAQSMAYDANTNQFLLFGGLGADGPLNDTWTWSGTDWTQLSPTDSPPARWTGPMAYDPATSQLILFGGSSNSDFSGLLSDTWTWNGTDWTQLFPADMPPARGGSSDLAYDPATNQLILFGGTGVNGELNDTWTWNGTDWTQLFPADSPTARDGQALAYDSASGQMILFGGFGPNGLQNDTWAWDGTDWTPLSPANSPSPRGGEALAYDPALDQLVLFGGESSNGVTNDTWTWDGTDWTQLSPADSPDGRYGRSESYDPASGQLLLFGGLTATNGVLGDTWVWDQVVPQTITVTSTAPSEAFVGGPTYFVTATGGASDNPITFSIDQRAMSVCVLSGSSVSFIGAGLCIVDANQTGNTNYAAAPQVQQSFYVSPGVSGTAPTIASKCSTVLAFGTKYTCQIISFGNPAPTVAASNLPHGLKLTRGNDGSAIIGGLPKKAGVYLITITASNSYGSASQSFTLTVQVEIAPTLTSSAATTATVHQPFTFTVSTSGTPTPALTASGLPSWLAFTDGKNGTGALTAAKPQKGTYKIVLIATNVAGSATQHFTLAVKK